jgi:hypothetical protein
MTARTASTVCIAAKSPGAPLLAATFGKCVANDRKWPVSTIKFAQKA